MKTIQLSVEKARELYKTADETLRQMLRKNFSNSELGVDIFEIKSWEMFLKETKQLDYNIIPYSQPSSKIQKSLNAAARINALSEFFNEGIIMDFNNKNQEKWRSWWIKEKNGWRFHCSGYCFDRAYGGFGCFFKDEKTSNHVAKYFLEIYQDCLP